MKNLKHSGRRRCEERRREAEKKEKEGKIARLYFVMIGHEANP